MYSYEYIVFFSKETADFYRPRVIAPPVLQPVMTAAACRRGTRSALSMGAHDTAGALKRWRRGGRRHHSEYSGRSFRAALGALLAFRGAFRSAGILRRVIGPLAGAPDALLQLGVPSGKAIVATTVRGDLPMEGAAGMADEDADDVGDAALFFNAMLITIGPQVVALNRMTARVAAGIDLRMYGLGG